MMTHRSDWFDRLALALRRPRFFSKYEWWYHWLLMPVLFPIGNYYFVGPRYFSSPALFGIGTGVVFGLYWFYVILLTVTIRKLIQRYPRPGQTLIRMLIMLTAVGLLTVGLAVFDVWVYSLIPATGVRFSWAIVRPIWALGLVFDVFLCMALGLGYTYTQWNKDLRKEEQMQQEVIRRQYDTLKGQLNPHFLFNSLNSLAVLIRKEPGRAEELVDKLAFVYRYMLQPGRRADPSTIDSPGELVTLEAELAFMRAYADLLHLRYGRGLQIAWPTREVTLFSTFSLPPLSLQILLDNAIQYNGITDEKPLRVTVEIADDGWLLMSNNRNKQSRRLGKRQAHLEELTGKYRYLSKKTILVDATDAGFQVAIPLLTTRDYVSN